MKKKTKVLISFLLFVYTVVLLYFLFFSERYGRTHSVVDKGYNLVPFQEINRYIEHSDRFSFEVVFMNLYGNILAFIPFGILVPSVFKKFRRFYRTTLFVLIFSFLVEIIQYTFNLGCLDIDDFILNTFGGILGYVLYYLIIGLRLKNKGKSHEE